MLEKINRLKDPDSKSLKKKKLKSSAIGGLKKITLNANQDYPLSTLKDTILDQYINDINRPYFQDCDIAIGTNDNQPITTYIDNDGDECDFWKFCSDKLRNSNHALRLFILSVKVGSNDFTLNSSNTNSLTRVPEAHHSTNSSKMSEMLQTQLTSEINSRKIDEKKILQPTTNTSSSPPSALKLSQILSPSFTSDLDTSTSQLSGEFGEFRDKFEFKIPEAKTGLDKLNLSIKKVEYSDLQFTNVTLGRGGQGIVIKGFYLKTEVAIKSITKSFSDRQILKEISLLDKIRHQNIISIMAVSSTPTQFHIVMEFFDSISLYSLLFDESKKTSAAKYMSSKNNIALQLCTAVSYLHLQTPPIVHRDIKPANLLINEIGFLKLCDLGLGKCSSLEKSLQSSMEISMKGTYFYIAPEIVLGRGVANTTTDVWAVACTLVELFSGNAVWQLSRSNRSVVVFLTEKFSNYKVPNIRNAPTFMQKTLLHCFSYSQEKRPSITVLQDLFLN
ncbi:putative mitogen-activated protein kinase kinase kinase 7-like [Leptopilina boulardi]|uniref:putative mitogen-activated protein kinase kinase kinase 7-like n=1 Tax=Leptopilina boulardi TaxID=63433 RepID=UPI0021F5F95A|nr:putative mitogen-activated protein kinase kinase kinase 7-like [Leptopilina boulardi]